MEISCKNFGGYRIKKTHISSQKNDSFSVFPSWFYRYATFLGDLARPAIVGAIVKGAIASFHS